MHRDARRHRVCPPGFAPFTDSISCDNAHWCSALTIDRVACNAAGTCNDNCIEPVNFAFIQTDGMPAGPPSPQLSGPQTFTPNAKTLRMNQGDRVVIHMFDAKVAGGHAFEVTEKDTTTGRSGFMIASAANGFMNTARPTAAARRSTSSPNTRPPSRRTTSRGARGRTASTRSSRSANFEPCTRVTGMAGPASDPFFTHCHGRYETDTPADTPKSVEPNDAPCYRSGCDVVSGQGCVLPPQGPGHFLPFWTLARVHGHCAWEFGNKRNGNTFGRDRQYGPGGSARTRDRRS